MEQSLLKDYEKWCQENKKDPFNEEALKEFKALKEKEKKDAKAEEEAKKVEEATKREKLRKLWAEICDFVGKDVKFNEDAFNEVSTRLEGLVYAMDGVNKFEKIIKILEK